VQIARSTGDDLSSQAGFGSHWQAAALAAGDCELQDEDTEKH
jgi:hypothetical protein